MSVHPKATEYARGIVLGDLLVADFDDPLWQSSMMLIVGLDSAPIPEGTAMILVPKAPHMKGGWWLNGRVPAVTLSLIFVPETLVADVWQEVDRMNAALHAEPTELT